MRFSKFSPRKELEFQVASMSPHVLSAGFPSVILGLYFRQMLFIYATLTCFGALF